jgi:hypothetical protein
MQLTIVSIQEDLLKIKHEMATIKKRIISLEFDVDSIKKFFK